MLINGQWITSKQREQIAVINPATEEIAVQMPRIDPGSEALLVTSGRIKIRSR